MYHYADCLNVDQGNILRRMFSDNTDITIDDCQVEFYVIHVDRNGHEQDRKYIRQEQLDGVVHKLEQVPNEYIRLMS
jgi:glutaredoxin